MSVTKDKIKPATPILEKLADESEKQARAAGTWLKRLIWGALALGLSVSAFWLSSCSGGGMTINPGTGELGFYINPVKPSKK